MPEIQKYIEEFKNRKLYEARQAAPPLSGTILEPGNGVVNEDMARIVGCGRLVLSTFRGKYAIMNDVLDDIYDLNRVLDGWTVIKAIEAEGQRTTKEQEEKGLLAKMGIGG